MRLHETAISFLTDQARHSSQAQEEYLQSRIVSLRQIGELVRMQGKLLGAKPDNQSARSYLFDRDLLEEFAAGSVERCLGKEYSVFQGRRIPRIPNGDLLLMDRVIEIHGMKGRLNQPSEIVTEYDVPVDAWFFQDSGSRTVPYSILMEMALQPCGFLSAYLGTMLLVPQADLYFRNLDGEAWILKSVDLRGRLVTARARMLSHTLNEETVIQSFEFQLETGGQVFFKGQSVFGFFPEEMMARQLGLDGGNESQPLFYQPEMVGLTGKTIDLQDPQNLQDPRLSRGKLALVDEVYSQASGGNYGNGYIYACRQIDPEDWYFKNHFFQDPVMPGSLGVEAILESMRIFAVMQDLEKSRSTPAFDLVEDLSFGWKYRGQILSTVDQMQLEVHIRQITETSTGVRIVGDASLWAGKIRIYQLRNCAIRIAKG